MGGEESQGMDSPIASREDKLTEWPELTELVDSLTHLQEVGVPAESALRESLQGYPSDLSRSVPPFGSLNETQQTEGDVYVGPLVAVHPSLGTFQEPPGQISIWGMFLRRGDRDDSQTR